MHWEVGTIEDSNFLIQVVDKVVKNVVRDQSTKCCLAICQIVVQEMPYLYSISFKKNTLQKTKNSISTSSILKDPSIECEEKFLLGLRKWKLALKKLIVKLVQAMYISTTSRIRVNESYSDTVDVKLGVYQGSVLSSLLFIIVLEVLSCEFRTGTP